MHRFAQILVSKRVAQVVVGTTLVLGLVLGFFALRVQRSDDLLAFLPRSNADVATFYEINKRFGGLELALVGVETNDPFDAKFMRRLRKVTEKLNEEKSIGYALSLANVEDFQEDTERGGMNVGRLVAEADTDRGGTVRRP